MSLTWDWGDGTVTPGSLGAVASHTYADVADFVVTARVLTSDGRNASWSQPAGIIPPPPVLQSISQVGATSSGVASGLLQEWPAGTKTLVYGWTEGCPSDPRSSLDAADQFYPGFSWVAAQDDGTFSRPINNLQPAPAGYVVQAQAYVDIDGQTYLVEGLSNCVNTVGAVAATSSATVVGEDEVPVDSSSVPVGHVAVIDAGTSDAEQRVVTAHGSLVLESGLAKAHPAGAQVVDAGAPVAPYTEPGPPPTPAQPTLPAGRRQHGHAHPDEARARCARRQEGQAQAGSQGGGDLLRGDGQRRQDHVVHGVVRRQGRQDPDRQRIGAQAEGHPAHEGHEVPVPGAGDELRRHRPLERARPSR